MQYTNYDVFDNNYIFEKCVCYKHYYVLLFWKFSTNDSVCCK